MFQKELFAVIATNWNHQIFRNMDMKENKVKLIRLKPSFNFEVLFISSLCSPFS